MWARITSTSSSVVVLPYVDDEVGFQLSEEGDRMKLGYIAIFV